MNRPNIHIVVDSLEIQPWLFQQMPLDKKYCKGEEGRNWDVPTTVARLPVGTGDYSMRGWIGQVSVERKSVDDCLNTLFGFGDRRDQFKKQLETMADMKCRAVIVEGSFGVALSSVCARGRHSETHLRRIFHRTVLSWGQKFHVPWIFVDGRVAAAVTCYRLFELFLKN